MAKFDFEAFTSYKRVDRSWANRLGASLKDENLPAFVDTNDLRAGEDWREQLKEFTANSRHFLLVWSARTQDSIDQVIPFEITYFDLQSAAERQTRRMLLLLTDDAPPPAMQGSLHALSVKEMIGMTADDAKDIPQEKWDVVVKRLARELRRGRATKPINLVVLATSRDWWSSPSAQALPGLYGRSATEFVETELGLTTAEFATRYRGQGESPTVWKPFGAQGPAVAKIVAELENQLGRWAGLREQPPYEFLIQEPAKTLQDLDRQIRKLAAELSLIIIDPLAGYDRTIAQVIDRMGPCFRSPRCAVVTLGPYGWLDKSPQAIQEQLNALSARLYEHLFDPPYPPPPGAHSASFVADLDSIKRLILLGISDDIAAPSPAPILGNSR